MPFHPLPPQRPTPTTSPFLNHRRRRSDRLRTPHLRNRTSRNGNRTRARRRSDRRGVRFSRDDCHSNSAGGDADGLRVRDGVLCFAGAGDGHGVCGGGVEVVGLGHGRVLGGVHSGYGDGFGGDDAGVDG